MTIIRENPMPEPKEHTCEGMPKGVKVVLNEWGPRWDVFDDTGSEKDEYYSGIKYCPWCRKELK